ncbi:hypothetical protein IAR55_003154 [Kwoniella newhampshirensis]|uniref:CoA-binding domain-containing protein n=1 Tax=Kwoniella newhampshirensis TaxID=1651941 RepID=A0AAW0Z0F2_9TREE
MSPVSPAMKSFLSAEKYAVIGRVLSDRSRFDNKVLRWYQARDLPVTAVRPDKPSEVVEGLTVLTDPLAIPDLSKISVSIIIHPSKSLPILQSLYPSTPSPNEPHSVWFQPGADDASIWSWVKERKLEGKVVGQGACVLRDGDGVLREIKRDGKGRL